MIPLRDVTLAECADAARRLGVRIGAELAIPVYLYEAAALRPDRTSLPQVRRDSYERLATTITTHSDRTPDYGPNVIGSAGAVAIGARGPLIAFNAYLDTANLEIAQSIAREIRESNGGLPRVRALGLLVGGTAQVSMNLIDFRVTGLLAALEAVIQKAESHGTRVVRTELVGLVPLSALVDAALSALQLPRSAADLILETRIGRGTGDYRPIPFE